MSKKRKYDESYVEFGFGFMTDRDGIQQPQCFLCGKVLCNDNMRPGKLREHFLKMHSENSGDGLESMRQKKARFQASGTLPKLGFVSSQKPALEASYKVAYLIAKHKKPHTIGETLVKPCALEMVELMCGKQQRKEVEKIPLSNNVIHSRIVDLSADILDQAMKEIKESSFKFSLQLDESTDVSHCSQLLAFARYIHNGSLKEEFLFCEPLVATTKAPDIYKLVKSFFQQQDLDWKKKLDSICTDGAPALLGNKSGFAALVRGEAPHVKVIHCILHRHALASRTLPPTLKTVLATAVKVVNFIRARSLNHRLFKILDHGRASEHLCEKEERRAVIPFHCRVF